jgi:two-component system chemotaxis response regulator CheY
MRILLADDDRASRVIAETAILGLGHECETVSDGTQAWDAFRVRPPDVVISDLAMPGLTGLALCREIREHELGGYTYFILYSGHGGHDRILEGMNAGADDYLIKPLDSNDLEAHLISADRVTALHRQLGDQRTELERLNGELTAIGLRDPLTGLGNRRALKDDLVRMEARVNRYGHSYCLALLDVDHFKAYNDTYGHQAGDQVLQVVAARLKDLARTGDALYRYGGEEFLCIFPEQSPADATLATERMRSGLEKLAVPHAGNGVGVLTLSAGVATLDADDVRTADEVLRGADEALYRAKRLGRNRVEYAKAPQPVL